jgi:uncharacterized MAPEG superfamily protein
LYVDAECCPSIFTALPSTGVEVEVTDDSDRMGLLTMSGSFLWVNALFPPVLAGAFFGTKAYLASAYADQLVAMYGVPVADVPMVVAVYTSAFAFFSGIVSIMYTAAVTNAYDNNTPRIQRGPDLYKVTPLGFRLQSAHNNALETVGAYLMPCFFAATTLKLDPVFFAKLAAPVVPLRVLFTFFYATNMDALRSGTFVVQNTCIFFIGFASFAPAAKELMAA